MKHTLITTAEAVANAADAANTLSDALTLYRAAVGLYRSALSDGCKPERARRHYPHGAKGGRTPRASEALHYLSRKVELKTIAEQVGVGATAVSNWVAGGGMSAINAAALIAYADRVRAEEVRL